MESVDMLSVDHRFKAMGGPCRLRFECADDTIAGQAVAAAEAEVRRLEDKYSRYLPDSLTTRINRMAGADTPVPIDEETAGLLGFAHTLWQQSGGLFDLTAGILRRAWNFKSARLPGQAQIDQLSAPDRLGDGGVGPGVGALAATGYGNRFWRLCERVCQRQRRRGPGQPRH